MDVKDIETLAAMMVKYNLTALRVREESLDIRMERGCPGIVPAMPYASPVPAAAEPMAAPVAQKGEEVLDLTKTYEVKAPVVGVFYSASGPDQPPFVKVGDHVKKGQVLCIVEAMKLMN